MAYSTIEIIKEGPVAKVWLDRPKVKNAFNEELIGELTDACRVFNEDKETRVVTLSGRGEVFSAGADLNWMQKVGAYTYDENYKDALTFAGMMHELHTLPQATVAAINGACIGGGVGLLSACDVAVASDKAFFSLAEIRLGIAPAAISPYVIRKIEERKAREFFLTGKRFDAETAYEIGLLNEIVAHDGLDDAVARWEKSFLKSAPGAIAACKKLISRVSRSPLEDVREYTAEVISGLRMAPEAREGFAAFFEKRRPNWDPDAK